MMRSTKIQYKYGALAALGTDFDRDAVGVNSPVALGVRSGGSCESKTVQLTGDGANTENLFKVTGAVRLLGLYGVCTAVVDSDVFSDVKFELDDGTAQDDLTTAVDASGIVTNGLLIKQDDKITALAFFNPTSVKQIENSTKDVFDPIIVLQKTGDVDSFIRLAYTGSLAEDPEDTDVTIKFYCRWSPLSESSKLEAVA